MMIGVHTRIPGFPPGVIHHTPLEELFTSNIIDRVWFAGSAVTTTSPSVQGSEEEQRLVNEIIELAEGLYPLFPRSGLRLTTRILPSYPISSWPRGGSVGRGTTRSSPITYAALVYVLPANEAGAALHQHFHIIQPYNHVHQAPNEPELLCLHMASAPGRGEDVLALGDILRDFRRGWKKHLVKIGENGSQRVWTNLADGRRYQPVMSYNDMSTRPFEDTTLDL